MSDLVGNPKDRFSHNEAQIHTISDHLYLSYFRLDYCGIAFLEMGSFVPYLYYSFYCRLGAKITYVACIIFLGTLCLVVSLWDKFSEPRFRALRAGKCLFSFLNHHIYSLISTCSALLFVFKVQTSSKLLALLG